MQTSDFLIIACQRQHRQLPATGTESVKRLFGRNLAVLLSFGKIAIGHQYKMLFPGQLCLCTFPQPGHASDRLQIFRNFLIKQSCIFLCRKFCRFLLNRERSHRENTGLRFTLIGLSQFLQKNLGMGDFRHILPVIRFC